MIPPNQATQQAMMMQRQLTQRRPEDQLLQALSQHQMAGEMIKERANHAIKMLKLKMKYGRGGMQQPIPAMTQPGVAPQGGI